MSKKTHEEYVRQVAEINQNIEVVGKYINHSTNILHRCKICNHEWNPKPTKILQGTGCPACYKQNRTSGAELKVYYYIKKYFTDAISGYQDKINGLYELDIYIPSQKFAIEYDGGIYHNNIKRDQQKDEICKRLGIKLIRIREPECPKYKSSCGFIFLKNHSLNELSKIIVYILEDMGIKNPKVNLGKDAGEINNLIFYNKKKISLAEKYPEIAAEWHPIKNGNLMPENVTAKSGRKVWWKCLSCGNEWESSIYHRTIDGHGCLKCASQGIPKSVYCAELNQIFTSIKDAERKTTIGFRCIHLCCRGKIKSTGKNIVGQRLHWYYVEDQTDKDGHHIDGAITLGFLTLQQYEDYLNNIQT